MVYTTAFQSFCKLVTMAGFSLMVLGWSAGRDTGGSLPSGESNIEGFEVTEDDDATLNLIPFPFC